MRMGDTIATRMVGHKGLYYPCWPCQLDRPRGCKDQHKSPNILCRGCLLLIFNVVNLEV